MPSSNFVSHLCPLGDLLASTDENGKLLLTNTNNGRTFGTIDFGHDRRVTHLHWATNIGLIVGNEAGEVIQADIARSAAPNSPDLAMLSLITRNDQPVKGLCFDIAKYLLAVSFHGELQIWRGHLARGYRREWVLYDTLPIQRNGTGWPVATMAFFSNEYKSLFVATDAGFAIWAYSDKSLWWYDKASPYAIGHCAVSPNSRTLVVSTRDFRLFIWPLSAVGPVSRQQRTFRIPASHGRRDDLEAAPVNFLTSKSIVTADPFGAVYIISLDGQMQSVFSIGDNFLVKSIWVHYPLAQIIALGPRGSPMFIGCTDKQGDGDLAIAELARSLVPWPRSRIQDASTELRAVGSPSEVADAWLQDHWSRMDGLKLVIAIAELWYRGELLGFGPTTAWKIFMLVEKYIWTEMFVEGVTTVGGFVIRLLLTL
ncbi:hypothetical protein FRC09_016106, partial [Ceratobasidium sp. 395]